MDEKSQLLAISITDYITSTALGLESALYKTANGMVPDFPFTISLDQLKRNETKGLVAQGAQEHWNITYNQIALKTVPEHVAKFQEFQSYLNHSPLCLISLIAQSHLMVHMKIDRSCLNTNSYQEYLSSFKYMFRNICNSEFITHLASSFQHECHGPSELPIIKPGQPQMFYFGTNPPEGSTRISIPVTPDSESTEDKNMLLAKKITGYLDKLVRILEKRLYRATPDKIELLTEEIKHRLGQMIENFWNKTHGDLFNKTDPKACKFFNDMITLSGHSMFCLLDNISKIHISIHMNVPRNSLEAFTTEGAYISSVRSFSSILFDNGCVTRIAEMFHHSCNANRELPELPPGKPMYKFEADDGNGPPSGYSPSITFAIPHAPILSRIKGGSCKICGENTVKRCKGCVDQKYYLCGRECQEKDWSSHPNTCKNKNKN